jgi:hypothetical protein
VPPTRALGQQDPAHLAALYLNAQLVGGLDQRVQGPLRRLLLVFGGKGAVRLPGEPARRVAADQTDNLASLGLVQAAGATRARPVTESLDTLGVKAVQPLPHGLGMAPQPLGDLTGALALPASDHDAGAQDPVGGRMAAGRQPAHSALLVQVSGRSGVQQRRHGRAPYGRIQGGREQTEHSTTYRI